LDFKKDNYIKADVRKLPFKDNYADYIIARQLLEHIPIRDVMKTLREWYRVLKPKGVMVITCPDFNGMAKEWLATPFNPVAFSTLAAGIFGNQLAEGQFHQCPITPDFMKYCLDTIGIKEYEISVYPMGHPLAAYKGYERPEGHVYRYDDIHIIVKK
jgi:ubiquinone/menaquinone biosynthesis C-methylase UbiE